MNDKEILSILNSIDYDTEEINELERLSEVEGPSIGEDLYNIQNDKVLKNITFLSLEKKIKGSLKENEEIEYKMILLQSFLEKEIFAREIGAFGAKSAVYIALFVTNKRIFSFRMDSIYNVLEEYSNELINITNLSDLWNECETIGIKFNDDKELLPRPFGEENKELFLNLIKYLKEEQGLEFGKYKGEKKNLGYWIYVGIGILAALIMLNTFKDTIKFIIESLKKF